MTKWLDAKSVILSSGICCWQRCIACGWGNIRTEASIDDLKRKIENLNLSNTERLKLYTSGSFLDDKQFPKEFRKWFVKHLKLTSKVDEIVVESRPEFVTKENIEDFTKNKIDLTVAIGLECADNNVLKKYKKGFAVEDYLNALKVLHENKAHVRTYVLVNMPFSDQKKLDKTAEFLLEHLKKDDTIVLINTYPHMRSALFDMWIKGEWKPYNEEQFNKAVEKWKSNKQIDLDSENYLFIPKFPNEKKEMLKGPSIEVLKHPHFEVWQDYFQRFYKKPDDKTVLLFVPCAFKKPYSKSETHKAIYGTLRNIAGTKKVHMVVVSNPGVVPIEYDNYYPFNSYDWPEWDETPEVMKEYAKVVKERVKGYLKAQKYEKYYCFLKYSETYKAVQEAAKELGIKIENLLDKKTYEEIKDSKNPIIHKQALDCLRKIKV